MLLNLLSQISWQFHYYVAYPDGSGTGWSHWNMKNK
jgi:hypothetical protein